MNTLNQPDNSSILFDSVYFVVGLVVVGLMRAFVHEQHVMLSNMTTHWFSDQEVIGDVLYLLNHLFRRFWQVSLST